jgi:hypothetical protein
MRVAQIPQIRSVYLKNPNRVNLMQWLSRGGFYPLAYTQTEVDAYLANVLRRIAGQKSGEKEP